MFKFDGVYFKKALSDEIHRAFDIPTSGFSVSSTELLPRCNGVAWTESYEVAIPEVVEDNTPEDPTWANSKQILDLMLGSNQQTTVIRYMLQVEFIKDDYDDEEECDLGWVAFSLKPVVKNNISRITKKQRGHFIQIKPTIASWRFMTVKGELDCTRLGDEEDENETLEELINDDGITENEIRIMKEHVQIVDTFLHDLVEYFIGITG